MGTGGVSMHVQVMCSNKVIPSVIAQELREQLGDTAPKLLVYFMSSGLNKKEIAKEIQEAFPNTITFGCCSYNEMITNHWLQGSVVALSFDETLLEDVSLEVVTNMKQSYETNIQQAFDSFSSYYGVPMKEMNYKEYVGMTFMDSHSLVEEGVMETISRNTNVLFVGGSASDQMEFGPTPVFANGKVYEDAAVLVLMKPSCSFEVVKTQSFVSLGKKLIATKVDTETRSVLEFNGKPAIEAYAEAFGVPKETVQEKFFAHPVGLIAGEDIFVRSPSQVKEDGSMVFVCTILEGMEVEILANTDIIGETKEAISHLQNAHALVQINCAYRYFELAQRGLTEEYIHIFQNIPNIGFTSFGEAFLGHMNQTATMLIFHS